MPGGGKGRSSEKSCSPCCSTGAAEDSPPLLPATKSLYTGDVMKPTQGTLPSSKAGFLVSFLVDARGGAMTGHRHWGMRVIIPPAAVQQPTRINCRYQQLSSLPFPPPFMEREALASRVIEVTPAGETFRSPVLIEIPHFASNAGAERETIVLRSDDGETWYEHVSDEVENGEIYQDVVTSVVMKDSDLERIYDVLEVTKGRIIRILTSKFPKYFAVLTRVREEVKSIGPDGGKVLLLHEPRLRATFPKNALYKKIKVGLQVQSLKPELVQAAFGRSVEVSKMIAVEPRKRKFHQPIFVSIPLPCNPSKINPSTSIRLLCSVTGATDKAAWADLTGTTPLELCKDVVHFSTKVSAIFWILVIHDKQRDPESALLMANKLYEESILIPYLARFSIFYRENFPKAWVNTIRIYCMTDDKAEKVIKSLQGFRPLAISGDIKVPHTSSISVKLSGNVIQLRQDPFTGELLAVSSIRTSEVKEPFVFKAFEDNSMTLLVQPKDPEKPVSGCLAFGRRLDNISATQNLPLCDIKFDVSGGDTSFVIKEDMTFETLDVGVNGQKQDIIDAPPPVKSFTTIEEEDPYEKIEIKKNKDDTINKQDKDLQKKEAEISKGKREENKSSKKEKDVQKHSTKGVTQKQKSVEKSVSTSKKELDTEQSSEKFENKKENMESKQIEKDTKENEKSIEKGNKETMKESPKVTKDDTTRNEFIQKKGKTENVVESKDIEKTVAVTNTTTDKKDTETDVEYRSLTKNKDEKTVKSVDKVKSINKWVGLCVHNVKITDPCGICDAALEHQTLKRTSPKLAQKYKIENKKEIMESKQTKKDTKPNDKAIENKNKETIKDVPEETIRKNSVQNDAKTSKVFQEADIVQTLEVSLEETKTDDVKNAESTHTSCIIDGEGVDKVGESTNQLTKENDEKEFLISKNEVEIPINRNENESTIKQDEKIHSQSKTNEIKESDSFLKDESKKKKKDDKSRKRTREFKSNELDAFRGEFAKKQGVKETKDISAKKIEFDKKQGKNTTKVINTNQAEYDNKQDFGKTKDIVANKSVDTNVSKLEENVSSKRDPTPATVAKEQICIHDISVKDDCKPCDDENFSPSPIKEERKKKARKSKDIKESESLYEPVGKGRETSPTLNEKQQSDTDKVETKEIHFEPETSPEMSETKNSGTISNITDDLKDFGSLKRKNKQPEKTGSSIENLQKAEFNHSEITDFQRRDDVIGFDIDISNDDTNPFIAEEEFEEIEVSKEKEVSKEIEATKEIKVSKDIQDSKETSTNKDLESPTKVIPPPLPARRKNSRRLSSSDSAQNEKTDKKEKKTSFIKEWQKDLKEFFSLGKGKKRNKSLSRGSSSKRSDSDSRQVDFSKYEKDRNEDHASKEHNLPEGENNRFSPSTEDGNGDTNAIDKSPKDASEQEDIYGYSKDLSGKDVDADIPISNEYEPISNKTESSPDAPVVDESAERRKKKRRDRRKTNSESSCTKVEIPQLSVNDDVQISICDENQKNSEKKSSKQAKDKTSEKMDGQEKTDKEIKRRNKNKDMEVSSEVKDLNSLSVANKPKVVVPSPPGIPRPKPISKRDTNRDSMVSDDGFFMEESLKTERNGSVEETEEFKKAVESFDQIYLLESGNGSPEISSNRSSSSNAKKLTTSAEDTKADLSPNTAWKKLKTGKSFDASETSSNGNELSDIMKFQMNSEMITGNQKKTTEHEKHDNSITTKCSTQSITSESSSYSHQSSTIAEKKTSSKMLEKGVSIESSESNESRSYSSVKTERQESQETIENKKSNGSSTMAEKKTSSKILQKGTSIESSESNESRSYSSEKTEKQESQEIIENNRKNEKHKSESSSNSSKSSKSSKKNKKNRKSNDISEKSGADEIMTQEDNISANTIHSSQVTKIESMQSFDQSEETIVLPNKPENHTASKDLGSPPSQVQTKTNEQSKSSKRNKKGKNTDKQNNENPIISSTSQPECINNVPLKEPSKRDKKNSSKKDKNNKHNSQADIEEACGGSLPVQSENDFSQVKDNSDNTTSSNKIEKVESSGKQDKSDGAEFQQSRKISILGQNYTDSPQIMNTHFYSEDSLSQGFTSTKKESRGFLSDEEREELEKENLLVKAIREFQAQSSNESTQSEVSSQMLNEEYSTDEVQYSQLEKQIIEKSMNAQETIKTALEDIENSNHTSRTNHSLTEDAENRLGEFENSDTLRVQKHSLSIQDGVLIEQTTTERFSKPTAGLNSQEDSCTIDPESLKNVDGPAKQRKGSARFSKRQGSKSKSPGLGHQSSFSGPDDRDDEEETINNTDLTTRLEETNVRMKKLSEVFNVMCDDPRVEPNQENNQDDAIEAESNTFETEEKQTSFHPLTRTTQIIRKECPLDEVIGTMLQKPENLSSSSQFSSSVVSGLKK